MFVALTPPKVAITPLPPTKDPAFVTPLPSTNIANAALLASQPGDVFVPAWWPYAVAHLCEQFNPLVTLFPAVQHYGSCGCWDRGRADSCRNALTHVYCSVSGCPYEGKCGNGLEESPKVFLGLNVRTAQRVHPSTWRRRRRGYWSGEVLGQYLGEIEHVSVGRANRSCNGGYRLVVRQRPEKPAYPVCAAINAEGMGGFMRFLNHSCKPAAEFKEVSNRGRKTAVVATTRKIKRGDEVTVDYGGDLWFVCRCMQDGCRHRSIQDEQDP
ncbi:hypothetical protein PF011_g7554 [Phytophthora fragariae]|uniref:SET domain-containing protein n=1 Tax=Phytophthora fragariae TaxID=53985 RepID=A0A6A3LIB3_9STRA|nr:hypothetical protein PF011_g7554 [Phytophthora fragariae]